MAFEKNDLFAYEIEGQAKTCADPLRVRRLLLQHSKGRFYEWISKIKQLEQVIAGVPDDLSAESPEEVERLLAVAAQSSCDKAVLEGQLLEVAYKAFEVNPVDPATGEGLPEAFLLEIVQGFMAWLDEKKA